MEKEIIISESGCDTPSIIAFYSLVEKKNPQDIKENLNKLNKDRSISEIYRTISNLRDKPI